MVDLAQLRMKYPEAKLALVQACDGYWDVASDQDTGVTIKRLQDEGKGYEEIAKALVSYALAAKSGDNISLTIVPLY